MSVTDRCNFRCDFCMPQDPKWMDGSQVLTFDELTRVARMLAGMGVTNIRLSGGEPLMRPGVEDLVGALSSIPGISAIGMTTNGLLLGQKARLLKERGLHCVTVSIHSLKPERYHRITGTKDVFSKVMWGLDEARRAGFERVKVNCVVTRGCNEDEVQDFARLAHDAEVSVRFIEYMPFDGSKLWDSRLVVSGDEIVRTVEERYPLIPLEREPGATARHYLFGDKSKGEVGVITSMSKPFCSDCDRIRLTADGKVVPCLFSNNEYDLKPALRGGSPDTEISEQIRRAFLLKDEGVERMLKDNMELKLVRPMHTIGG